jgi:hypothetical protein
VILLVMTPCSLVDESRRFGVTLCCHLHSSDYTQQFRVFGSDAFRLSSPQQMLCGQSSRAGDGRGEGGRRMWGLVEKREVGGDHFEDLDANGGNIKMEPKELGWQGVEWIAVARGRNRLLGTR